MRWSALPLLLGLSFSVQAQTLRPALDVKAIVGARIQVSPSSVIEKGTIVIRNGLIAEVGPNVVAPKGADVIDGTGLTVYAGFIDAGTSRGLKVPTGEARQEVPIDITEDVQLQMRSSVPSVKADLSGSDLYNPDDEIWKGYRSAGFTTALVVPSNGVIVGKGSLINLDGRPRRNSTLLPSVALGIRFVGQGNGYPGTVLGAYATARQAFMDSSRLAQQESDFRAGGPYRPEDDPALKALQGNLPLLIQANSMPEIDRAMDFAKEFSRACILWGGANAWKIPERVKRDSQGVVLSLAFGKEPIPEKKPDDPKQGATNPGQESDDEPLDVKQELQRKFVEKVTNPASLEKAGIPFALTSEGTKDINEFLTNLRRAVKAGLSKEAALAGLTTNPSKLFGLERVLGTVEPGKIANLTITSGDFLAEGTKTKWVFIDGIKIDPAKTPFKYSAPRFFGGGE